MPILKFDNTEAKIVRKGLERKIIHTGDLMTVLLDFSDGPWKEKEPPHSHSHVQTSYIAEGEIIFYCEGEPDEHLKAGDMFVVPSGKLHTIKLLTKTARLVDSFSPIREDFL
ncbi:cupin domain-containing protein [Reichenbachiella sp. MALMAid0571]|uniref:cupin domain-containing protein n=1 Tax=Reichenbachiella sp. MALMAid0571 TaxID=3143939 RepID=UPI0032DF5609